MPALPGPSTSAPTPAPAPAAPSPPRAATPIDEDLDVAIDESSEPNPDDEEGVFRTRDEIEAELELLENGEAGETSATRGLAVKPFLGVVKVAPSNAPPINKSAPSQGLSLDFVHGYRCHDSRNNLIYNAEVRFIHDISSI